MASERLGFNKIILEKLLFLLDLSSRYARNLKKSLIFRYLMFFNNLLKIETLYDES